MILKLAGNAGNYFYVYVEGKVNEIHWLDDPGVLSLC
jgi:hypothetical protein